MLPCVALVGALLSMAGCDDPLRSLGLPEASPSTAAAPRARAAVAAQALECDDLPTADQEESVGLPPEPSLGKAVPVEPATPYVVLPEVLLSDAAAAKIAQIDRAYARRTRGHLVVTSGTRDAARQARAMYTRIKLGADLLQIYRNKAAAREIKQAYLAAAKRPPEEVVSAMQAVIQSQIDRGVYISAHLRAGAVDVRSRSMSPAEKKAFVESVSEAKGVMLLEEMKPSHYHLQIDG